MTVNSALFMRYVHRGEHSQLAAFFAAVGEELPRVLEIVAIDDFSKDALRGNRRAVRHEHQGHFALGHYGDRHFDDPILPLPEPEMQSRCERIGLVTGPLPLSAIK